MPAAAGPEDHASFVLLDYNGAHILHPVPGANVVSTRKDRKHPEPALSRSVKDHSNSKGPSGPETSASKNYSKSKPRPHGQARNSHHDSYSKRESSTPKAPIRSSNSKTVYTSTVATHTSKSSGYRSISSGYRSISSGYLSDERMDNYSNPPSEVFAPPALRVSAPKSGDHSANQSVPQPHAAAHNSSTQSRKLAKNDRKQDSNDGYRVHSQFHGQSGYVSRKNAPTAQQGTTTPRPPIRRNTSTSISMRKYATKSGTTLTRMHLKDTFDKCVEQCGVTAMQGVLDYLMQERDGLRKIEAVIGHAKV